MNDFNIFNSLNWEIIVPSLITIIGFIVTYMITKKEIKNLVVQNKLNKNFISKD
jgi:hypothetical protein